MRCGWRVGSTRARAVTENTFLIWQVLESSGGEHWRARFHLALLSLEQGFHAEAEVCAHRLNQLPNESVN